MTSTHKSSTMQAMVLQAPAMPLQLLEIPIPTPNEKQILIKVEACGICRTDLHILDGELTPPHFPLILGHQIVGVVTKQGAKTSRFQIGQRVGVSWLGKTCGQCHFCLSKRENLCEAPLFTGYSLNGGFAEFCVAYEDYCYLLPDSYSNIQVAPLLCGGFIGFRAFRMVEAAEKLGFYGFGSSAHMLIQIARYLKKQIYVFTKPKDFAAQDLSKRLGAVWVGSSDDSPPVLLDAALIFAPVGALIPKALEAINKGGSVICAGIHMSDIPSFPYKLIYEEKILRSVAHLTREDGDAFLKMAAKIQIEAHVTSYPLHKLNEALHDLRKGKITGSAAVVFH